MIVSSSTPFIPELMVKADDVCKKVLLDLQAYCKKTSISNPMPLYCSWTAFAGIGAVAHWNIDWPALSKAGIYETLTKERGYAEMDEYVLDMIGLPHKGAEASALTEYIRKLGNYCCNLIATPERTISLDALLAGMKAMYAFGMIFEMNRLGMK